LFIEFNKVLMDAPTLFDSKRVGAFDSDPLINCAAMFFDDFFDIGRGGGCEIMRFYAD
jgi:hypothetical protein